MKNSNLNYNKSLLKFCLILVGMFGAILEGASQAPSIPIIYVRKNAPQNGDGSSWAKAFSEVQDAIQSIQASTTPFEIWVARGEYKPTKSLDRSAAFIIPPHTFLYGGFVGTETSKEHRNWQTNRTILSGDIGKSFDSEDNSFHVIVATGTSEMAGLDGFIITDGNANGTGLNQDQGAGLFITTATNSTRLSVRRCEFLHNTANKGGAVSVTYDAYRVNTVFDGCYFNGNEAQLGGAVATRRKQIGGSSFDSNQKIINCSFSLNNSYQNGGALYNDLDLVEIMNSTFCKNNALVNGGAIFNVASGSVITLVYNSIFWKNFVSATETEANYQDVYGLDLESFSMQGNILRTPSKNPKNWRNDPFADPMLVREPSRKKYPKTMIIPAEATDLKNEKMLAFSGPKMPRWWTYNTFKDLEYNKIYMIGSTLLTIDLNTLTDGLPTSRMYPQLSWGRTQNLNKSIHVAGNAMYIASYYTGLFKIDRSSGTLTSINVMEGEPVTFNYAIVEDVVVDNENNLLYAPVFIAHDYQFYGLLELNLETGTKRWINKTSSPVSIDRVNALGDDTYWAGQRIYLDEQSSTLYYSTGHGVWWWKRYTHQTGYYTTSGGIPILTGNPQLPSDLATSVFVDNQENKVYIGTHAGLYVWDRTNRTSRIYNKDNSALQHNLINHMTKNDEQNLLYVACEEGGLFILNTKTGEQNLLVQGDNMGSHPGLIDTSIASAYYDKTDKKLYVSSDHWNGGTWIADYGNLIEDFGDLGLQSFSPAIDMAYENWYSRIGGGDKDIKGNPRFYNSSVINGRSKLDIGAYEKEFSCDALASDFTYTQLGYTFTFTPTTVNLARTNCKLSYSWDFGTGSEITSANPTHRFDVGTFEVTLKTTLECNGCSKQETFARKSITIKELCQSNIFCRGKGPVSIGTQAAANGYMLSVNGRVVVEGAHLALVEEWPDYVFKKGYNLLSLPHLHDYIKKNGHLPEVPSAGQVKESGVDLGETSALLLKKIEELSLHLINLDKRLDTLEQR